jgi:hypothetical protein
VWCANLFGTQRFVACIVSEFTLSDRAVVHDPLLSVHGHRGTDGPSSAQHPKRLVRSGRLADAEVLFDTMPSRDEVAYTILLAGHAAAADFHGSMALFARLRGSSAVSSVFVATALAAVSRTGSRDVASLTMLIASYVQTGRLEETIEEFVRMLRDEASNSASSNEYTFSAVIAACP